MTSTRLVQSVTRTLLILEQLAQYEDGLSLQQLGQLLDLKGPTLHNLLRTLAARGYVERLREPPRYRLGPSLLDLADQYRSRSVQRFAAQAVNQIFARFPFARVTYSEAVNGDVVLKLRMTPERPGLLERPWHAVMLAYTSATVLVFQAFWREDQRLDYAARYPFAAYGAHVWESAAALETFLAQIRRQGYADPPADEQSAGYALWRIAVPVFNQEQGLVGALGVAFNPSLVDDPQEQKGALIAALQSVAATFADLA